MHKNSKIFVAGGKKLIGAAIHRVLKIQGFENVVDVSKEPDLTDTGQVAAFFQRERPQYVFLAAGKSGGIAANQKYPAELMLNNLLIQCNVIEQAYRQGVQKLLYLASSCCYPRHCPQPMEEEQLLTGPLEFTNEPYAVAKLAGLKLTQSYQAQYGANFISAIPANCFGPGDDFSLENSHVIAALMRRMHDAKRQDLGEVTIWGTGKPKRDFIFADDLADACIFIMQNGEGVEPINLGSGEGLSISELALMIRKITGFPGNLVFDTCKPDGMPVKLLNTAKLKKLGWQSTIPFRDALEETYRWFLGNGQGD